jgi:peptide subunit release factor 1 (eRF1)
MTAAPRRVMLTRPALLRLLARVDAQSDADGFSLYLPPGAAAPALEGDARSLSETSGDPPTGRVLFHGQTLSFAVIPPFPLAGSGTMAGFDTAPLRELLTRERTLGVVLVRLGGYSVGLYRDGAFVSTKTGGRFVKNRHRKGGQSQRRFERIREGQIREHFDDVGKVVADLLLPEAGAIDHVVLGGDRHTVQSWLKRSPLPPVLSAKLLPGVLDVPEPRREVLERTPVQIWSSRVIILREPPDS